VRLVQACTDLYKPAQDIPGLLMYMCLYKYPWALYHKCHEKSCDLHAFAKGLSYDKLYYISLFIILELPTARVQLCPTLYHLWLIQTILCTEALFFYTVVKCCRHTYGDD